MEKCKWGGARPGAGRKANPEKTVRVQIMLTERQHQAVRDNGGSRWVGQLIDKAVAHKKEAA